MSVNSMYSAKYINSNNFEKAKFELKDKAIDYVDQNGKKGTSTKLHTKYVQGKDVKNLYLEVKMAFSPVGKKESDKDTEVSVLGTIPDKWMDNDPQSKRDADFLQSVLYHACGEQIDRLPASTKRAIAKELMDFKLDKVRDTLQPLLSRVDKKDGSGKTDLGMFLSVSLQNITKKDANGKFIEGEFEKYGKTRFVMPPKNKGEAPQDIPLEYMQNARFEGVARIWLQIYWSPKHSVLRFGASLQQVDITAMERIKNTAELEHLNNLYDRNKETIDAAYNNLMSEFADIKPNENISAVQKLITPAQPGPNFGAASPTSVDQSILFGKS